MKIKDRLITQRLYNMGCELVVSQVCEVVREGEKVFWKAKFGKNHLSYDYDEFVKSYSDIDLGEREGSSSTTYQFFETDLL